MMGQHLSERSSTDKNDEDENQKRFWKFGKNDYNGVSIKKYEYHSSSKINQYIIRTSRNFENTKYILICGELIQSIKADITRRYPTQITRILMQNFDKFHQKVKNILRNHIIRHSYWLVSRNFKIVLNFAHALKIISSDIPFFFRFFINFFDPST